MSTVDLPQVLDHYTIHWPSVRVESLGGAGGFSGAQFWRLTLSGQVLCLRRWPMEHPDRTRLSAIHRVLRHVSEKGITYVPRPWETRGGSTIVQARGHLWELTRWMPGQADYCQRPNRRRLAAALRALARFHRAAATLPRHDSARVASPGILERQCRLRDMTQGGADRLEAAVRADRQSALARSGQHVLSLFAQLAPSLRPVIERAAQIRVGLQPCVRDIWHDHVLLTGDEVTGLVDFGALRDESVAGDVARLLGSLVADDAEGWRGGLEAYESIRRLSDAELALVFAFDGGNVALSGLQWLEWIYGQGRRFENPAEVLCRLNQILARMQSMLQRRRKKTWHSLMNNFYGCRETD